METDSDANPTSRKSSERPLRLFLGKQDETVAYVLPQTAPPPASTSKTTRIPPHSPLSADVAQWQRVCQTKADQATQVAAIFAHELAQPLCAVMNYVEACRRMLAPFRDQIPDKAFDCLDKAVDESARSGQVIVHLRSFLESNTDGRERTSINSVIERACAGLAAQILHHRIELKLELDRSLPMVLIDPVLFELVVANLVRNGIEALMISERKELTITSTIDSDRRLTVTISDSGQGFPASISGDLFRPVKSDKPHGMGIGLAFCHAVVDAHGGWIQGQSLSGRPTSFVFSLPSEYTADDQSDYTCR